MSWVGELSESGAAGKKLQSEAFGYIFGCQSANEL